MFIGNKVYAVTNRGVGGAPVTDVSAVDEELFFGETGSEELPPGILDLILPDEEVDTDSTSG